MVAPNVEMEEILRRVALWPAGTRLNLARHVLETIEQSPEDLLKEFRGDPVEAVLGMLSNGKPPPDDEEGRRIIEEERMKKYGS